MSYSHASNIQQTLLGLELSAWAQNRLESEKSATRERLEDTMIPLGTVSHATMREEDLIPAFLDFLFRYAGLTFDDILNSYHEDTRRIVSDWIDGDDSISIYLLITDDDIYDPLIVHEVTWLLNEDLWDRMNDLAPGGYYFGAHPGDGSDYGYWKIEEEF